MQALFRPTDDECLLFRRELVLRCKFNEGAVDDLFLQNLSIQYFSELHNPVLIDRVDGKLLTYIVLEQMIFELIVFGFKIFELDIFELMIFESTIFGFTVVDCLGLTFVVYDLYHRASDKTLRCQS